MTREDIERSATNQALGFGMGAINGALTQNPNCPRLGPRCPQTAAQLGQAMGAAAARGAGLSGMATAGLAVGAAKLAAASAVAAAAAPVVAAVAVAGGIAYGVSKLLDD